MEAQFARWRLDFSTTWSVVAETCACRAFSRAKCNRSWVALAPRLGRSEEGRADPRCRLVIVKFNEGIGLTSVGTSSKRSLAADRDGRPVVTIGLNRGCGRPPAAPARRRRSGLRRDDCRCAHFVPHDRPSYGPIDYASDRQSRLLATAPSSGLASFSLARLWPSLIIISGLSNIPRAP